MSENNINVLLSGYIDGELTSQERQDFENRLKSDPELQKELEKFNKLKEITGAMKYADIPDSVWEGYWASVYKRMERGIGWILMSLSAVLFLAVGCYYLFLGFFLNPEISIVLKIAVGAGLLGLIVMLVSLIREHLFAYNRDRYREVKR
jgi:hypothetical protein